MSYQHTVVLGKRAQKQEENRSFIIETMERCGIKATPHDSLTILTGIGGVVYTELWFVSNRKEAEFHRLCQEAGLKTSRN